MIVRWALLIAPVIRGAGGACASDTPWRNHRTTNENEVRLCVLELISFVLLILELTSTQTWNCRAFNENHLLLHRPEGVSRQLPQRLKPASLLALCGTAEALPIQNRCMRWLLDLKLGVCRGHIVM